MPMTAQLYVADAGSVMPAAVRSGMVAVSSDVKTMYSGPVPVGSMRSRKMPWIRESS